MSETNAGLARRGWEAALRGDLDAITALLDPQVQWHGGDPTSAGACHNRDQAVQFMRQARERRPLPDLVDVLDAGDKVVVILRRPAGEDGQRSLVANLTCFRDGKVVEMVHYEDPDDALTAAGLGE
ncbi:MAG: nuclear transport factor 2 family protein [Acidimicrobiales bacterium]